MADFSDLLKEAEQLANDLGEPSDMPRVNRSLPQVLEASADLFTRVTSHSGSKDIQANLLLGSKGIDLSKISQKLDAISSKRTLEPLEPIGDNDIPARLENEICDKIVRTFSFCAKSVSNRSYKKAGRHMTAEWMQEKRKILNALGGRSGAPIEINLNQSVLVQSPMIPVSLMDPIELVYASKMIEYNNEMVRGGDKANLINVFCTAVNEFKDAKIKDMWEMLKYMVQLSPHAHSEDPVRVRSDKLVIKELVGQGKKYLEDRYKTYMNVMVTENITQAARGGIPGTYSLVRSYVGLRLQGEYLGLRDGLVDDRPLWPMVYYCLRSGDLPAAIYCLNKSGLSEALEIVSILEAKVANPKNADTSKLEDAIRFAYRRFVRNETDPFKRIVWAVLGCCDISDEHSEVARTADDYLWLKLSLVRTEPNRENSIRYNDLQQVILEEYGESHYDAFNQPHLYFQVLILTGQFEAAIEFLARVERYKVHAVHMAIAVNQLYLLAGPRDTSAPLIYVDPADPKPVRRLNLARLIMIYVKSFEFSCPNEALHYFYHLKNYSDPQGQNLFKVCVADLAMETREYEKILGRVREDGVRSRGLIDQFADVSGADSVAEMIGKTLVEKGLLEEAIDLFDIANNQDEILNYLCKLLSQLAPNKPVPDSLRSRIHGKAVAFAQRFYRDGYKSSMPLVTSFLKLKDLVTFFDLYHAKEYSQALKTLNDIQLVPLREEDVTESLKTFRSLNTDAQKTIPDVLLATMNMIFAQYQNIRAKNEYVPRYQDVNMETQLSYLRLQARTITNYSGMLPYKLPADVNSRLVQMEILMH